MFMMMYHQDMTPTVLDRLLQIGDLFARDMERAFAGTALTPSRVGVLWILQHTGPSTQQALAHALEVSPRNITGLVDALEASGHVERAPHPSDRRAFLVTLTEAGRAEMTRMQTEHAELTETLLAAVDPADRDAFTRGLDAVARRLQDLVAEASPR
jgi:DNA-binding MarR family transcriptional regulator